jgi:hypothetical protein
MKVMSTLTPADLLNQLINNANAAKAKAEADALAAQAEQEAKDAEAKKLADALCLASSFEPLHKASVDRLVELEKAATSAEAKADAESFVIEQVKNNFASAQNLLNSFDAAKKLQEDNLVVKDQLDFLSNFLVQQMTERGL